MTLTEFLLARIAEDEGTGGYGLAIWNDLVVAGEDRTVTREEDAVVDEIRRRWTRRFAAECEAKRRIVAALDVTEHPSISGDAWIVAQDVLSALALPYADHPDYNPEWKP